MSDYGQLNKNEKRAIRLATDALHAALAGDWDRATRAIQRTSDECGAEGVGRAILGWSDTLISRMPGGKGKPVRLAFMEAESGRIDTNADLVPPRTRWAGQVLAARAADDEPTWAALMDALPDDGQVIGEYVSAVLEMVALTLGRIEGAS